MSDINFCPYCNASQHKILMFKGKTYFCNDCNKFFSLEPVTFNCPKCDKTNLEKSDFPGPGGDPIFQCKSCRKMFPMSELFDEEFEEE